MTREDICNPKLAPEKLNISTNHGEGALKNYCRYKEVQIKDY